LSTLGGPVDRLKPAAGGCPYGALGHRRRWSRGRIHEQVAVSAGPLLGRAREIAAVTSAVEVGRERGSVLLVVGEPGIGKSALLSVARAAARDGGYTVIPAMGVETGMHLPFDGVQQMLAPLIGGLDALPRPQREALRTALGLSDGSTPDLFLIAQAAYALLVRERRRRPVLVVVDDVQWLDPQSHQILTFFGHRAAASGLCIVGAVRAGHTGPFTEAGFPELAVHGVDDVSAETILRAHAGALGPAELRRIRHEALGNPLALMELPRSWGGGPVSDEHPPALSARLEQAFAGRIAGLPAPTRDALLLAAVGSSSDTAELLAALSALGTPGSTPEVFGPAALAGLITQTPSSVAFRHPLIRSAVLQRETVTRRHAAHRALAEVLTAEPYRRTWHRAWSLVGPDDAVADELAATAPDSLRRGAVMSAVSSLERSAQLTGCPTRRGGRLLQAAQLAFGAGRPDVVARILREASDVDLGDLDRVRSTWLTEVLNDDVSADSDRLRELCDAARRAADLADPGLALDLLLSAALRCWWVDGGPGDRARVVGVLDGLAEARDDPRRIAAVAIAEPVLRGSEVMAHLRRIALDEVRDGDSLRVYGMAAYGAGDFVLATDLLDRAGQAFRDEGRLGPLPVVLALQLHIRLDLGDWSGAVAASDEVTTVSMETGQPVFAENNVPVEARGMALRGEWRAALDHIAGAEAEAARLRVNDRLCLAYQARGTALLSAGRPAEAFDCLKRQFDPEDAGYHLRESFAAVALLAEAAVDCGRVAEARAIVSALEAVAVVTPSPLLEVNLLYARAVLAPGDACEQAFRDALGRDLARWPWIRARVQLEYGRRLARGGRGVEAGVHLRAAREVFAHLGAERWHQRAVAALAGAGDPPPEDPDPGRGRRP
jgi:AAA ATPase domain